MSRVPFLVVFLLFSLPLQAEEPALGRTADGRAYRTDAQGNQIVDYIAELELSVDSLKRRVHGLEYDLEEKQRVIARLSGGSGAQGASPTAGLQERDLLSGNAKLARAPQMQQADCRAIESQLETAHFELDQAKDQLREERVSARTAQENLEIEQQVHKQNIARYQQTVSRLEQDLKTREGELQAAGVRVAALHEKVESKESQASHASQLSSELREQIEREKARVREARLALEQKEIEMQRLKEQRQKDEESRASLKLTHTKASPAPSSYAKRLSAKPPVSAKQRSAVQALKGNVKRELQQVVRLIQKRDQMYRSFKSQSSTLTFKPQQARTKRGRTVAKITAGIAKASSVSQLAVMQRELREINTRVKDDIALMQRLS